MSSRDRLQLLKWMKVVPPLWTGLIKSPSKRGGREYREKKTEKKGKTGEKTGKNAARGALKREVSAREKEAEVGRKKRQSESRAIVGSIIERAMQHFRAALYALDAISPPRRRRPVRELFRRPGHRLQTFYIDTARFESPLFPRFPAF